MDAHDYMIHRTLQLLIGFLPWKYSTPGVVVIQQNKAWISFIKKKAQWFAHNRSLSVNNAWSILTLGFRDAFAIKSCKAAGNHNLAEHAREYKAESRTTDIFAVFDLLSTNVVFQAQERSWESIPHPNPLEKKSVPGVGFNRTTAHRHHIPWNVIGSNCHDFLVLLFFFFTLHYVNEKRKRLPFCKPKMWHMKLSNPVILSPAPKRAQEILLSKTRV